MNRDIRVGSAPSRSYLNTSLSSSYEQREEITQRGYLNRKCEGTMGRKTKVLHREKNWQLYWCNLKGAQLELFKIDGLKLKPGEPPPKDIIPPTSLMKGTKVEMMNMEGALVELDYVSQENKDIQKRRKFLFRVVSQNDVEYIMQAPNLNLRKTWVLALQAVAHNMPVEDDVMVGHAIKASRDSIKHTKIMNRNKRTTVKSRSSTNSSTDDSDYVEFSTAEAMVAAGGDPRLQALRKRLQAKKELLKQLNRMYTSFLGGNAAAMYDETLILNQLEPPTFDSGSPLFNDAPPQSNGSRRQSKKVVHRKLTVSDSALRSSKSVDYGSSERVAGEEDKRASVGEMSMPAVLTAVSPLPLLKDDALETELVMDYYLVPGAEWSLVKKGETVQIIGKARETGWYRCMALRDSRIKLDNGPFSFLSKSLAMTSAGISTKSKRMSGITPEMIEEEYSRSEDNTLEEAEDEGIDSIPSSPPPPLMPRSPVASPAHQSQASPRHHHTSPLHHSIQASRNTRQVSTEDLFDMEVEERGEPNLPDITEGGAELSGRDSTDSEAASRNNGSLTVKDSQRPSSGPSPDLSEVSSASQEDAKMSSVAATSSSSDAGQREAAEGGEELPEGHAGLERRRSYQMATDDEVLDSPTKDDSKASSTGKLVAKNDTIKRSTSSADNSSQAAIKLRKNLESSRSPRAVSTSVYSGSLYQSSLERLSSSARADSAYLSLKMPASPAGLDHMIDKEVNTSPYQAPLIGCIPPSALKCFAERKEGAQSPGAGSPAHSNSDIESGGSQSRPVSDALDTAPTSMEQSSDQPTGLSSVPSAKQEEPMVKQENIRKYSNAATATIRDRTDSQRFGVSISMDDDSDGEADRRQALIFKQYEVVDPEQDKLNLKLRKGHMRAQSLPPPMHLRVDAPPVSEEGNEEVGVESSLDRKPSHLRRVQGGAVSPEPLVHMVPPCQSVGSSPIHKPKTNGRVSPRHIGGEAPIGALFESPSRSGLLKKIFSRRNKSASKLTTPEHTPSGRTSPGPPPGMLKQVLLGNVDPYYDEDYSRARLSSASGRPVVQKGMGFVIGDESSSESEEEEEEEEEEGEEGETSLACSLPVDPESSLFPGAAQPQASPSDTPTRASFSADKQEQLFTSLDQTKLEHSMRARRARTPEPNFGRLKRSVSDHDSLKLKAKDDDHCLRPGSSSSLKRNVNTTTSLFPKKSRPKPRAMTTPAADTTAVQQPIKKNRLSSKKRKGRLLNGNEVESGEMPAADQDTATKISGIFRQPARGEKRFVYLDPSLGKYGFRLQSYGRLRDQGKVMQTFVQSVNPGSPSFMAGLYPGDTIVEVNGKIVKYAPVEDVVMAIQEAGKGGERVTLLVEFVDGVTRLDCMQKSDEFKNDIKTRQKRLEELRGSEVSLCVNGNHLTSPPHLTQASQLPVWSASTLPCSEEVMQHKFPFNRQLNEMVAVHSGAINSLGCDVLVMPISSCHKPKDSSDKNILLQLLRTGGPELLDDLSLAKQCKIGEIMSTPGHALPAKYVYHCVFGDLEESLQNCCHHAMESAFTEKLKTVVFWLDGFASLSVSPHLIIDAVRNWMQQDMNRNVFDRVIFSSKANSNLVVKLMHESFPLYPTTSRDSGSSFTASQEHGSELVQNGTESVQCVVGLVQNGNESMLHQSPQDTSRSGSLQVALRNGQQMTAESGHGSSQNGDFKLTNREDDDPGAEAYLSTEDLLESLDAIQDENMKTFEELVGKLAAMAPEPDRMKLGVASFQNQDFFSRSLPSHYQGSDILNQGVGSVSPSAMVGHNRSHSGDHILNPERMESDV